MAAGRVIDRIPARARRPPFEPAQLRRKPRRVEQFQPPGINQAQQVDVEIRFRPGAWFIADTVLAEPLARPFAAIAIADHGFDAIAPQQVGKFFDDALGVEGRPRLPHRIEDRHIVRPEMRDRQRHRIRCPAGGVAERGIGDPGLGRQLAAPPHGDAVDRLAGDEIGEIIAKLGAILSPCGLGVILIRLGDDIARNRRVHGLGAGFPDQNAGIVAAVMLTESGV